jgi:hypothetical protein
MGGISLGMCEDLLIDDNRIEQNGVDGVNPSCGIFVTWGEQVSITHNRVLDNGPLPLAGAELTAGIRGGIVLDLATSFSALDLLRGAPSAGVNPLPAVRIHNNVVSQPVGQALRVGAAGPVMCSDNAFASEQSGLSVFEHIAGTVLIHNVGGVQRTDAATQLRRTSFVSAEAAIAGTPGTASNATGLTTTGITTTGAPTTEASTTGAPATGRTRSDPAGPAFARSDAAERVLPGGATQFHDNQSRTGPTNTSTSCHTIVVADDLGYQGNHSACLSPRGLIANGILRAESIRAALNRMTERGPETLLSLWTIAVRMNDTSLNQGDHCIIATDQNPTMTEIKLGNQIVSPSLLCAPINLINIRAFKTMKATP